jgi:drug/metabolite transporter (DMT)-like permease
MFIEFCAFYFFMFLSYLPLCLLKGVQFFKCKNPRLIIIRAVFAVLCIWFFGLAQIWTKQVDNSIFYSTDALWIVLILMLLGLPVSRIAIWGVAIGIGGIFTFMYAIEFSTIHDLIGGVFGIVSGITLGIVTVLTRYMVMRDPPLRIGFYNSIIGFILSGVTALLISGFQQLTLPSTHAMIMMMFSGFLFALTLFCFLEAFYYTESYIIGAVSFFFPIFTEIIRWVVTQNPVSMITIIGSLIIIAGGLIAVGSSYIQDKFHTKSR